MAGAKTDTALQEAPDTGIEARWRQLLADALSLRHTEDRLQKTQAQVAAVALMYCGDAAALHAADIVAQRLASRTISDVFRRLVDPVAACVSREDPAVQRQAKAQALGLYETAAAKIDRLRDSARLDAEDEDMSISEKIAADSRRLRQAQEYLQAVQRQWQESATGYGPKENLPAGRKPFVFSRS